MSGAGPDRNAVLPASVAPAPVCARPVFIVGGSRAGTTWLQCLLAAHPGFFSRPETKFFQCALAPRYPLTCAEARPRAPRPCPRLLSPTQVDRALVELQRVGVLPLPGEVRELLRARVRAGGLPAGDLLNAVMVHAGGDRDHGARWIEKSPRHVFFLEEIFHAFPDARVLCIYRDGATRAWSAYRTWRYPLIENFIDGAAAYRSYEEYLASSPENRPRCMSVIYERLRSDPAPALAEVFDFLGAPPLDVASGALAEEARRSFETIYRGTRMLAWQPKMGPPSRRPAESARQRRVFMLAVLCRSEAIAYMSKPELRGADWLHPVFPAFLAWHLTYWMIFRIVRSGIDLSIRAFRRCGWGEPAMREPT